MDIEGGELAALQGADHIISNYSPSWLIEVHSRELEDECMILIQNYDYEIRVIQTQNWLPETRPLDHNRWIIATQSPYNELTSSSYAFQGVRLALIESHLNLTDEGHPCFAICYLY